MLVTSLPWTAGMHWLDMVKLTMPPPSLFRKGDVLQLFRLNGAEIVFAPRSEFWKEFLSYLLIRWPPTPAGTTALPRWIAITRANSGMNLGQCIISSFNC